MSKEKNNTFDVGLKEKYKTVDELVEKSQANVIYYTFLLLSAFVISAGLLLSNSAIVIGGMLVTPMLTPVLLIGLGISVGNLSIIKRTTVLVSQSAVIIFVTALLLGFLFGVNNGDISFFILDNTMRGAVLYFIVALTSGLAATFAWIRKEMSEILPGVAIAVSLVPPIAMMGIGLSDFAFNVVRFNFFVTFFNLFGILVGSILVFSLLKFYRAEKEVKREEKKLEKEDKK